MTKECGHVLKFLKASQTKPPSVALQYLSYMLSYMFSLDNTVRNVEAFQTLAKYFAQSSRTNCRVKVMDRLLGIFAANPANFLLVQHLHTLAHFIEGFEEYDNDLKVSFFFNSGG